MPASKTRLISPEELYAFSNLFALALTQVSWVGRFQVSLTVRIQIPIGAEFLSFFSFFFNRKQSSIAHKVHNYTYIGSI